MSPAALKRSIVTLAAAALLSAGAPALAASAPSGGSGSLSGKPSASSCQQALAWGERAAALGKQTANKAIALMDGGDLNGALVVSVIGRHDIAAIPNPGAAKAVRSADLAVLDNLIYQVARGIDDPYGYEWDDASYDAAMAELSDEFDALDAACGFSSSATGGV